VDAEIDLSGATLTGVDSITFGDGQTLILGDIQQADALDITGGTLTFTDTTGFLQTIDASGFAVEFLRLPNLLVSGNNVDYMFAGLPESVTKVIYNGIGDVAGKLQNVVVEEGTTIFDDISFNEYALDSEVTHLTLNLQGGTELSGDLVISTVEVNDTVVELVPYYLQELVINSTGSGANRITGETANIIRGDITPAAYGPAIGVGSRDNNLKSVTINADQAFVLEGEILFSSHGDDNSGALDNTPDDGISANDDNAAIVSLTVTGSEDVTIGYVNTSDDDVDGLNVINNSTGTLSLTIDAARIDQTANNNDALSFTGTGDIALTVEGNVNLSNDVLTAVDQITIADDAVLTLTQAQYNTLGAANILDGDEEGSATLHLVAFDPAVVFNAPDLNEDITIASITLINGVHILNSATNLTGVDSIIVPAGSSLTLTAEQFMQLENGTINAAGASVTILGLTQAMVDAGFSLDAVTCSDINLTLAESINLEAENDNADNIGTILDADPANVEFILDTDQILGLGDILQLSPRTTLPDQSVEGTGLIVSKAVGATGTAVELQFAQGATVLVGINDSFDASGINADSIRLLNDLVMGRNVELLQDIDGSVTVVIYETLEDMPGYLPGVDRLVVVENGVEVNGWLVFNDFQETQEIRNLTLTMEGDAAINGDLNLSTVVKDGELIARYFNTLTINSIGDEANTITGVITGMPSDDFTVPTLENNLRNVVINAEEDLTIEGGIEFSSRTDEATATLSVDVAAGKAVNVGDLDTDDDDVDARWLTIPAKVT